MMGNLKPVRKLTLEHSRITRLEYIDGGVFTDDAGNKYDNLPPFTRAAVVWRDISLITRWHFREVPIPACRSRMRWATAIAWQSGSAGNARRNASAGSSFPARITAHRAEVPTASGTMPGSARGF